MIQLDNVSCQFPGHTHPLFQNISLQVKKRECLLLTGRSGGGKSTLLKVINGIIPSVVAATVSGVIRIDSKSTLGEPLHTVGKDLGMVFQDCRSQFFMTHVTDELLFAANNFSCDETKIRRNLEQIIPLLGLEPLLQSNLFQLSSGERQRVAIASTAIYGPKVILFDEPSANLDPEGLSRMAVLLALLKKNDTTVIIADHRFQYAKDAITAQYSFENGELTSRQQLPNNKASSSPTAIADGKALHKPTKGHTTKSAQAASDLPLIELRNVSFRRKSQNIIHNLSLTCFSGEIIVLTGNNGAGKTTLLRILCGLENACKGTVVFENKPIPSKKRLRHFSLVMQDPDYQLFTASVKEELTLGKKANALFSANDNKLIRSFDLEPLLERHPGSLSMGEKQRVLIVSALLSSKRVLLLDEPTSGMDMKRMLQLATALKEYAAQGNLIVAVSHDSEFIKEIEARVYELKSGALQPHISFAPNKYVVIGNEGVS